MNITNKYDIGNVVFLRVASEKKRGMITRLMVSGKNSDTIEYNVGWGNNNYGWHYEGELTDEYLPDFDTACKP